MDCLTEQIGNLNITEQNLKYKNIEELVINLTENFTKILSINIIKEYPELYWGC